jgi:16S rRNA A1518/A1519 N6-dimethyltransferase RsmA/KsgA/DIM1 with predicted DNA glycosylase/AP lyase activity
MTERVTYVGKDLEAMSFAENYHRWILQIFQPYLGERLVEVGAGDGAMSELLLEHELESLVLVEPDKGMFETLATRTAALNVAT